MEVIIYFIVELLLKITIIVYFLLLQYQRTDMKYIKHLHLSHAY